MSHFKDFALHLKGIKMPAADMNPPYDQTQPLQSQARGSGRELQCQLLSQEVKETMKINGK